ncbi:multiple epidermal growth factor-like domains 10 [Elysia marginata]|uniref:Multiple epidermal growth factor-like domains 10 n=1 Tax=Elysia marginata TaxID=1093978 RepID=A0AAV4IBT4_9GAST|nr:multiple epidermal growth factor-like domains 10 [Elysia marginata]
MVCETNNTVEGIMFQGPVVNNLCSLYISKGRNIALKQPSTQSTNYYLWFASNAVDGRLDEPNNLNSQAATCSHTAHGHRGWWKVTFSRPVKIAMFFLYNRRNEDHENILQNIMYVFAKIQQANCCEERLMNFELTVLSEDTREPVFNYTDLQTTARDVYTVVPPTIISDAREVKIEAARDRNILTLCEVKVFGEVSCPHGWFGLACESQCNCVNQTGCFVHSGHCTSGCAVGYTGEDCKSKCSLGKYGAGCKETCSPFCSRPDKACNNVDGNCTNGCGNGYTGPKCDKQCPSGRHGAECTKTCSPHCGGPDGTCSHIDGNCTDGCQRGYTGARCEKHCPAGTHGAGCSNRCSTNCAGADNACHHVTGVCQGCRPGYYGGACSHHCSVRCAGPDNACDRLSGNCTNCKPGYYGDTCLHNCSARCAGPYNACDRLSGNCTNCKPGYYGDTCSNHCSARCAGPDKACRRANGYCEKGCDQGYKGDKCDQASLPSAAGPACRDHVRHDISGVAVTAVALVAAILILLAVVGVFMFLR